MTGGKRINWVWLAKTLRCSIGAAKAQYRMQHMTSGSNSNAPEIKPRRTHRTSAPELAADRSAISPFATGAVGRFGRY